MRKTDISTENSVFITPSKRSFGCEDYLGMDLTIKKAKAQLRSSSHRFNIETIRHGSFGHSNALSSTIYATNAAMRTLTTKKLSGALILRFQK